MPYQFLLHFLLLHSHKLKHLVLFSTSSTFSSAIFCTADNSPLHLFSSSLLSVSARSSPRSPTSPVTVPSRSSSCLSTRSRKHVVSLRSFAGTPDYQCQWEPGPPSSVPAPKQGWACAFCLQQPEAWEAIPASPFHLPNSQQK